MDKRKLSNKYLTRDDQTAPKTLDIYSQVSLIQQYNVSPKVFLK